METGANIVRRYAKSEPVERIDIICAHYENFTSIIDSSEPVQVEELIYPPKNVRRKDIPLPDFEQYYELFKRFIEKNYGGDKVSMPVERIPGEKMYIDWVGDQPEILVDTQTGEVKKVHVFTTTLGVT